jgi:GNAT superfamily N-acetyltransferase
MKYTFPRKLISLRLNLGTFFRHAFGSILVYETILVFETNAKTRSNLKILDKAKIDVRLFEGKSLLEFKKLADPVFRSKEAERRFEAGDLCFVAEKNGYPVNYIWVSLNPTPINEIRRKILVAPRSAYAYDGYTFPQYRGFGVHSAALAKAADLVFKNGVEILYSALLSNNIPSLRAHEKAGYRKMGQVTLLKFFKISRYLCKGSTTNDWLKLKKLFNI